MLSNNLSQEAFIAAGTRKGIEEIFRKHQVQDTIKGLIESRFPLATSEVFDDPAYLQTRLCAHFEDGYYVCSWDHSEGG